MIDLYNISLQFNGKYLFKELSYKINSGDRISLVGANGAGKSSLLKIIIGLLLPESGKIIKQKNISIGYLPQENIIHIGKTLLDEAKSALTDIIKLQEKEREITEELSVVDPTDEKHKDLINQLGEIHHRLEELDSYSASSKVEKILIGLGFEERDFERLTDEFSGGWQMRIALAKILISQNDLLLMDEPTNHLDIDSLEWLTVFLKNYKGAMIIVSHDKRFINSVTKKTLEIYMSKFSTFNGDYDAYLKFKEERDKLAVDQFIMQQKKIKETEKFIERFRYKATKAKQVQSRVKQLEKITLIEQPEPNEEIVLRFPPPPPSGIVSFELKSLYKSYGEKEIFNNLDFEITRGDKIAFVGPNGSGKSTLVKIISGAIDYNKGDRIIGYNTVISYYAQDVADSLNPELDLLETLETVSENQTTGQLRNLLGSFLFTGDDVFKRIGVLSGGEKSRVALAKILLTKSNLIILDEPTNHLDITSKQILQKALQEYQGSLILVSHDVDFLDPIVNRVVEIRKGKIKSFAGGIEYYLSKRENQPEQVQDDDNIHFSNPDSVSKRGKKRIEAEIRQKKYNATKEIIEEINDIEKEIEDLEERVKVLEQNLSTPQIYNNPLKARNLTLEFNATKKRLEENILLWEKISEKLSDIEKQFDQ
ncbi:MAG: ABC-F family ATP-binding cassette domain-containing protein [Ignavibacteriaceae bacterium]